MLSGVGLMKEVMESGRFRITVKLHCLVSPDNHLPAYTCAAGCRLTVSGAGATKKGCRLLWE